MTSSLVGSEMCIRDRFHMITDILSMAKEIELAIPVANVARRGTEGFQACLLYTSDAADDM
eukprot:3728351-Prorocentrum_lima.AAC.1